MEWVSLIGLVVIALVVFFAGNRLGKAFRGAEDKLPQSPARAPTLPPVPEEKASEFVEWYRDQTKPAVALTPNPDLPVTERGSRLFGPAFLPEGEEWPLGKDGKTLDFLCQIDLGDCEPLNDYPRTGMIQFFIGRDDLFGANFDDLPSGDFLVRHIAPETKGALHAAPHESEFDTSGIDDYSPSYNFEMRKRGVSLTAAPVTDRIDLSVKEAEERFFALGKEYDISSMESAIDALDQQRPMRHHTGGYPAFTQADIRFSEANAHLDHVLLRLTSDDQLMWGDMGEAVFMMAKEDLAKGDFSRVGYSWDCG